MSTTDAPPPSRFARPHGLGARSPKVTNLELFYDLVFVFAITQVSHLLLEELTWANAGRAALVLLVVWWAWNYTTWVTNELDPEAIAVRMVLVVLMLLSLLMAVAIPEAWGDRALLFAGSYVAIQVGRHSFLAFVAARRGTLERERAERILIWFAAAGVLWIAGALADGDARTLLWIAALLVDYSGPIATYRVPGLKPMQRSAWNVSTSHFAERFQLFVIIALGESIVLTGATTSGLDLDAARLGAFALAFLSTAAFWWLYFNYVAAIAERRLEQAADRVALARDGYTYLHVLLVAGIIVSAVGDELVIAHPTDVLPIEEVVAVVAGPLLYLVAHVIFRLRVVGTFGTRRAVGALACAACIPLGTAVSAIVLAGVLVAILIAVIAAEQRAGLQRRRHDELTAAAPVSPAG